MLLSLILLSLIAWKVGVFTAIVWVIKGMWYAYQTGRFSVYGIFLGLLYNNITIRHI